MHQVQVQNMHQRKKNGSQAFIFLASGEKKVLLQPFLNYVYMPHIESLPRSENQLCELQSITHTYTCLNFIPTFPFFNVKGPEPSATYAFNKVPRNYIIPQALPSTSTICESTTYQTFQQKRLLDNTREH